MSAFPHGVALYDNTSTLIVTISKYYCILSTLFGLFKTTVFHMITIFTISRNINQSMLPCKCFGIHNKSTELSPRTQAHFDSIRTTTISQKSIIGCCTNSEFCPITSGTCRVTFLRLYYNTLQTYNEIERKKENKKS